MKVIFKFLPAFLLLGLCSCEQTDLEKLHTTSDAALRIEDKTIDLVKSFKASLVNEKTKSTDFSFNNITIDGCQKSTYQIGRAHV